MKPLSRPLLFLAALAAGAAVAVGITPITRADDPDPRQPQMEDEHGLPIGETPDPSLDRSPEGIAKAIADLGSDEFVRRDAASRHLFQIGEPAREALVRAAESTDPEVKTRAQQVLQRLDVIKSLKEVNVSYKLRGYCRAGSPIEDPQALGGFASSENNPRPMPSVLPAGGAASEEGWYLVALPDDITVFAKDHRGMRLLLVNPTKETIPFDASDSRLSIVQEAKDERGEWQEIEYLPSSW